jgi:AcrR family transcriptional regulator
MAGTRQRIVAAAFELHATVGPEHTSLSAIAQRAGVQRRTVMAHFPDQLALFAACTVHGMERMGMPDPSAWAEIQPAATRFRVCLGALYAWYRGHAADLQRLLGDDLGMPDRSPGADAFGARLGAMVEVLAAGWPGAADDPPTIRAVVAHAVTFSTWRTLADEGLGDEWAVAFLGSVVGALAKGELTT